MNEIIKICLFALLTVIMAIQLKAIKPEFSFFLVFCACIFVFVYIMQRAAFVFEKLYTLQGYLGNSSSFVVVLLKIIGVTYICEFASGICKDAGYHAISEQVELVGRMAVMLAGLPILFAVIEQLSAFGG